MELTGTLTTSFRILIIVTIVSLSSGCSICLPGKNGTSHHLIIGIGVVSVNDSTNNSVVITDTSALGLTVTDRPGLKLGLGYASSFVLSVPDNAADVRVEVTKNMFGPMMINVPSAVLANYSSQRRKL